MPENQSCFSIGVHRMRKMKKNTREGLALQIKSLEEKCRTTQLKLAEKEAAYLKLERMIRLVVDNTPVLIWAKDLDNRYLFLNQALCDTLLFCEKEADAIGKDELFFAEREKAAGQIHTFGEMCVNSDEVVKEKKVAMRFLEDGKVRGNDLLLDVQKAPMFDQNGKLVGTVGCGIDITHQRKQEKELKATRAHQQLLLETTSDFVVFRLRLYRKKPRRIKVVFVSPSAENVAGIVNPMSLDKWFTVHPEDLKRVRRAVVDGFKNLRFNEKFRIYNMRAMEWRWIQVIATAAMEGKKIYLNGILLDMTDQALNKEAFEIREKELANKTDNLEEINTALKVLLRKRDEDRLELEEKVLFNVRDLINPYIQKMKKGRLDEKQSVYLDIIESNMKEIVSPLSRKLSYEYLGFTASEKKVANFIKQGKPTKEIAKLMEISPRTVEGFRNNLRERLGIKGKKINLRTHLMSIQ